MNNHRTDLNRRKTLTWQKGNSHVKKKIPRSDPGSYGDRWTGPGRRRRGWSYQVSGTCWIAREWGLCWVWCADASTGRHAYTHLSWSRKDSSPCPSPFRISTPSAPPFLRINGLLAPWYGEMGFEFPETQKITKEKKMTEQRREGLGLIYTGVCLDRTVEIIG